MINYYFSIHLFLLSFLSLFILSVSFENLKYKSYLSSSNSSLYSFSSITTDTNGNFYYCDPSSKTINKIDKLSKEITVLAGSSNGWYPLQQTNPCTSTLIRVCASLSVDTVGDIYYIPKYDNAVYKLTLEKPEEECNIKLITGSYSTSTLSHLSPLRLEKEFHRFDNYNAYYFDHITFDNEFKNLYILSYTIDNNENSLSKILKFNFENNKVEELNSKVLDYQLNYNPEVIKYIKFNNENFLTFCFLNTMYVVEKKVTINGEEEEIKLVFGNINGMHTILSNNLDADKITFKAETPVNYIFDSNSDIILIFYNYITKIVTSTNKIEILAGTGGSPSILNSGAYPTSSPKNAKTTTVGNSYGMQLFNNKILYYSDASTNSINSLDLETSTITVVVGTTVAGSSSPLVTNPLSVQFNGNRGIWIDTNAIMFICDYSNFRILKYDINQKIVTQIAGGTNTLMSLSETDATTVKLQVSYIIGDNNGNIYLSGELGKKKIYKLFIDPNNNNNYRIQIFISKSVYNPAGIPTNNGVALLQKINNPSTVIAATNGEIYLTLTGNNLIVKINLNKQLQIISGIAGSSNQYPSSISNLSSSFYYKPKALLIGRFGDIYFSTGDNLIVRIDPSNSVKTFAGSSSLCSLNFDVENNEELRETSTTSAKFCNIEKLVFGYEEDVIYVHDQGNNRVKVIYKMDLLNLDMVITLSGNGYKKSLSIKDISENKVPKGFGIDSLNNFYFLIENNIYRVNYNSNTINIVQPSNIYLPNSLYIDYNTNLVYFQYRMFLYYLNSALSTNLAFSNSVFGEPIEPNNYHITKITSVVRSNTFLYMAYSYLNLRSRVVLYNLSTPNIKFIIGSGNFGIPTETEGLDSMLGEIVSMFVYNNNLYLVDSTHKIILKYESSSKNLSIYAGIINNNINPDYNLFPSTSPFIAINPIKIVFDSMGNSYILSDSNILKLNSDRKLFSIIAGINSNYLNPNNNLYGNLKKLPCTTELTIDSSSNLYTFSPCINMISKINTFTESISSENGNLLGGRYFDEMDLVNPVGSDISEISLPEDMTIEYHNSNIFIVRSNSIEFFDEIVKSPTNSPTSSPSSYPTNVPSSYPTISFSPTSIPTTSKPSTPPTSYPTSFPTSNPSVKPSSIPTSIPSTIPTSIPSTIPTSIPTSIPSILPTSIPSTTPTSYPTSMPSIPPTSYPTSIPTSSPSFMPSYIPTSMPSNTPTSYPTSFPSTPPTIYPTSFPSVPPTSLPTSHPNSIPSFIPTTKPTLYPTSFPSAITPISITPSPTIQHDYLPTFFPTTQSSFDDILIYTKIYIDSLSYTLKPNQGIRLQATVFSPIGTTSAWNNYPSTYVYPYTNTSVIYTIYPNSLISGEYYYTIICNYLTKTVKVNILDKPEPGNLIALPSYGYEYDTNFTLITKDWLVKNELLPLKYSFYFNNLIIQENLLTNSYNGWLSKKITTIKVSAMNSQYSSNDLIVSTSSIVNLTRNDNFNLNFLIDNIEDYSDLALVTLETNDLMMVKTPLLESLNQFTNHSNQESILIALEYLQILSNSSEYLDERGNEITFNIIKEGNFSELIFIPINTLLNSSYISYIEAIDLLIEVGNNLILNPTSPSIIKYYSSYTFGLSLYDSYESDKNLTFLVTEGYNNSLPLSGETNGDYLQLIQILEKDKDKDSISNPISVNTNGQNFSIIIPYDAYYETLEPEIWIDHCDGKSMLNYTCKSNEILTQKCNFIGEFQKPCPVLDGYCALLNNNQYTNFNYPTGIYHKTSKISSYYISCNSIKLQNGIKCECFQDSNGKNSDKTIILMSKYVASDIKSIFTVKGNVNLSNSNIIFSLYGSFWLYILIILFIIFYKDYKYINIKLNSIKLTLSNKIKIVNIDQLNNNDNNNNNIKENNTFSSNNNFNKNKIIDINQLDINKYNQFPITFSAKHNINSNNNQNINTEEDNNINLITDIKNKNLLNYYIKYKTNGISSIKRSGGRQRGPPYYNAPL